MNAASRNRPTWGDGVVALIILLAALLTALAMRPGSSGSLTAQITLDGEVIGTYSLSGLDASLYVEVDGAYPLTLELSSAGVQVVETSCPGQDCLYMGRISQANRQIVCLPNRLVVTLQGSTSSYDAVLS